MNQQIGNNWRDPMTEAAARKFLGNAHFDWLVAQGVGYISSRISGYWDSNEPDSYAAYRAAKAVAVSEAQAVTP